MHAADVPLGCPPLALNAIDDRPYPIQAPFIKVNTKPEVVAFWKSISGDFILGRA